MKRLQAVPAGERYRQLLRQVLDRVGVDEPDWLSEQRRRTMELVCERGFPTRRQEAWKYTDISHLATHSFSLPQPPPVREELLAATPLHHPEAISLVLIDGQFCESLSVTHGTPGLSCTPLSPRAGVPDLRHALERTNPLMQESVVNLNASLWLDGVLVRISGKQTVERNIHIILLHTGHTPDALVATRILLAVGSQSEARVAITHARLPGASGALFSLPVTDVDLHDEAHLTLCQMQALGSTAHHLATTRIRQRRGSVLHSLDVSAGCRVARNDLTTSLVAPGSEATLDGVYLAGGHDLVDNHTTIEHTAPDCTSRQLYKGVLAGNASGVFNGSVRVHPGASGTDGQQTNRNLLLSTTAIANSKPELEISNDDVRCTHGATVGQLDPKELFYLHSRGISPSDARAILARGFADEVILRLSEPVWREALTSYTAACFDDGGFLA